MNATKADRLIIDLRRNGGGNNMLAEPLRRMIVKSRFNQRGALYVLTSPQTFSAAQNFATRLERETEAIFVGEPTGGAPNHFGDAKFAVAPKSQIPYIISTLRWQDSPPFDERGWILPDIPAPPSFDDYASGRDAALGAALADAPGEETLDAWARRVVEPWDRDSQKMDWTFFFEKK
jgi:C-terminal processing protease CtpA/Prc